MIRALLLWLIMLPGVAAAVDAPFLAKRSCDLNGGYRLDLILVDGGFGPFEATAVVLDARGVLVAWQPVGVGASPLVCETQSVFDQGNHVAWRPDPGQFAPWKTVTDESSDALWQFLSLMRDAAPWGFVPGDVPPAPLLLLAETRFKILWPVVVITCFGLCGLIVAARISVAQRSRLWGLLFMPLGAIWAFVWLSFAFLFAVFDAFSFGLAMLAFALAVAISALFALMWRGPRR